MTLGSDPRSARTTPPTTRPLAPPPTPPAEPCLGRCSSAVGRARFEPVVRLRARSAPLGSTLNEPCMLYATDTDQGRGGGPPRCLGTGVLLSRNAVVELAARSGGKCSPDGKLFFVLPASSRARARHWRKAPSIRAQLRREQGWNEPTRPTRTRFVVRTHRPTIRWEPSFVDRVPATRGNGRFVSMRLAQTCKHARFHSRAWKRYSSRGRPG